MKIFEKIKINTRNDKVRYIRFLERTILQYVKNGNKVKIFFPFLYRVKTDGPVFYLKFNSTNSNYAFFCLQKWIDIVEKTGNDYYIICDNKKLENKILKTIKFTSYNIKFLKSNRKFLKNIVEKLITPFWRKAAYAHLTTFWHAKKNKIKCFWNIDADDTVLVDSPANIAYYFSHIENFAEQNDINLFSLDMHYTRYYGKHWTFGVTYTRQIDFNLATALKHVKDIKAPIKLRKILPSGEFNLDAAFTALQMEHYTNIQTFNINNLYFIHWGVIGTSNMYRLFQVLKNKKLCYPIASECFKNYEFGCVDIPNDVKTFDFNILEEASYNTLNNWVFNQIKNAKECCINYKWTK